VLILALDASTPNVTVAVAHAEGDRREVLAEASCPSRGASETLLPAVHAVLGLAGAELSSVERIIGGTGPGTFTGIRIALSTARSLALATGAALCASSTLAALAAPALLSGAPDVLAVLDARRKQVFARRYTTAGPEEEVLCLRPEDLSAVEKPAGRPMLVGDGAVRYREELSGIGVILPEQSPLHRVTAAGHVLSANLAPVDPGKLVPVYVREPDAEVRRDLNPWSRA
jgi:tRNA threonylcarbamoyladenosine biosynthesis protein TsaB